MSTLTNALLLLFAPMKAWRAIAEAKPGVGNVLALHTVPMSIIPAIAKDQSAIELFIESKPLPIPVPTSTIRTDVTSV